MNSVLDNQIQFDSKERIDLLSLEELIKNLIIRRRKEREEGIKKLIFLKGQG